jgi:hypothetical protein
MAFMRSNARLDASHRGPSHPFKDASVVADNLTDIRSAMVKCPFVVNRNCIHKGLWEQPTLIQAIASHSLGVIRF